MKIEDAARYLDQRLELERFAADYSNNGLQLSGDENRQCRKIAFAVDATLATIQKAVDAHADMLIVHHGLSWGSEPRRWAGMTGKRMELLFKNDLALYAAHAPLDAHPEYGNNACLANLLNLQNRRTCGAWHGMELGIVGELEQPLLPEFVAEQAACGQKFELHRSPLGAQTVRTVMAVSGGAGAEAVEEAAVLGAEMLLTGEFTHIMTPFVQELPVHVAELGHYYSEVHGVRALQNGLANELGVETIFLDAPTGR